MDMDAKKLEKEIWEILSVIRENFPEYKEFSPRFEGEILKNWESPLGVCEETSKGVFKIGLNGAYALVGNPANVRATIAHEVVHSLPGCMNHGREWKKIASQLGELLDLQIERFTSDEKFHEFLVTCRAQKGESCEVLWETKFAAPQNFIVAVDDGYGCSDYYVEATSFSEAFDFGERFGEVQLISGPNGLRWGW